MRWACCCAYAAFSSPQALSIPFCSLQPCASSCTFRAARAPESSFAVLSWGLQDDSVPKIKELELRIRVLGGLKV